MKFLCIQCDHIMAFAERQLPGDGTLAAVFECSACGRDIAMLTNPMETQLVSSMGIEIGGRTVPEQPMELVRSNLEGGRQDAFVEEEPPVPARPGRVEWTPERWNGSTGAVVRARHGEAHLHRLRPRARHRPHDPRGHGHGALGPGTGGNVTDSTQGLARENAQATGQEQRQGPGVLTG